jgi:hypothetical protein
MAMYSFVPPFRDATFCGVPSCVSDKFGCAAGEKSLRNTGLKDGREYRVRDTVGLENVGPALAPVLRTSDMIGTIFRTLNHDDTTTNKNTLTTDLQIHANNQGSKQVGPDVFPLGEYSLRMRRTSFQTHLSTTTRQARKVTETVTTSEGRRLRTSWTDILSFIHPIQKKRWWHSAMRYNVHEANIDIFRFRSLQRAAPPPPHTHTHQVLMYVFRCGSSDVRNSYLFLQLIRLFKCWFFWAFTSNDATVTKSVPIPAFSNCTPMAVRAMESCQKI